MKSFLTLKSDLEELFPDGFDSLPIIHDEDLTLSPDDVPKWRIEHDQRPRAIILTRKTRMVQNLEQYLSRNIMLLPIIDDEFQIELDELKQTLIGLGITSLIVEEPQEAISTFLNHREAHLIVSTVLPCFFGSGTECYGSHGPENLKGDSCMDGFRFHKLGGELVYYGIPYWKDTIRSTSGQR